MSKKIKVGFAEKVKIVQDCLKGKCGRQEAGRRIGVNSKTIRLWIARYEAEGVAAFLPHDKNRAYPPETKRQAVQDYLSGKGSLLDICKSHKIRSTHQLRDWIKVYNAHGDFNSVKRSGGGSYMKQGRETTQEERIQIARTASHPTGTTARWHSNIRSATSRHAHGRCALSSWARLVWRIGGASGRRIRRRAQSWSGRRLKSSS